MFSSITILETLLGLWTVLKKLMVSKSIGSDVKSQKSWWWVTKACFVSFCAEFSNFSVSQQVLDLTIHQHCCFHSCVFQEHIFFLRDKNCSWKGCFMCGLSGKHKEMCKKCFYWLLTLKGPLSPSMHCRNFAQLKVWQPIRTLHSTNELFQNKSKSAKPLGWTWAFHIDQYMQLSLPFSSCLHPAQSACTFSGQFVSCTYTQYTPYGEQFSSLF